MLKGSGFLGTGASLGSDLTLLIEILLFAGLIVGIVAQRRRHYRSHDLIQTPVVLLNLVFILAIMVGRFQEQSVATILPQRPLDPYYLIAGSHAVFGLFAEGLAIYCLLAGWKILPRKVGQLRYFMWLTFAFWTAAVALGIGTYWIWYVQDTEATPVATALVDETPATEDGETPVRRILMQNFNFQPGDVTVVAGTEITWLNQDGAPHNVTFADDSVASENFFQGESYAATLTEPGVHEVYCTLHGNPGSGMAAQITVVEASAENMATLAETAAQEPTPNPIPPTPTPAPPVPQPPVALLEPPEPAATLVGIVSFHDVQGRSDQVQITLSGLAPPAPRREYQAWLVNSNSGQALNLGIVGLDAAGSATLTYMDAEKQNLLARFDTFQITDEPEFDDNPAAGPVVYGGRQPETATGFIRHIVVSTAETPGEQGYALGARNQAEELQRHVAMLAQSHELLSILDSQRHAEHIVNLLEGQSGEFFGDRDGVHGLQNPGDGFGIIPYIQATQAVANEAAAAPDATNAIRVHAEHVLLATGNALQWAEEARAAALGILAAERVGDIGPQVAALQQLGQLLVDGADTNGDGNIAPDEGGLFTTYQHGQYMAAIGVATGESSVVDIQPAPASGEPAESGELLLEMLDFLFRPLTLTIPAGTQVRFVNLGQALHSATASDGTFDTTLLPTGGESEVTFPEPGTYIYYCSLHGTADGSGMAATIVVEE